jgi:hypothetical protein
MDFDVSIENIDDFFEESTSRDKKLHLCPHCGKDINIKPE